MEVNIPKTWRVLLDSKYEGLKETRCSESPIIHALKYSEVLALGTKWSSIYGCNKEILDTPTTEACILATHGAMSIGIAHT